MKLILAAFFVVMSLMFTWIAAYLAIDSVHAWKVVSTLSAFLFCGMAVGVFINWAVDGDDY